MLQQYAEDDDDGQNSLNVRNESHTSSVEISKGRSRVLMQFYRLNPD